MGSHQLFHHTGSLVVPRRLEVEIYANSSHHSAGFLAFQNFDYCLLLRFLLAAESFLSHLSLLNLPLKKYQQKTLAILRVLQPDPSDFVLLYQDFYSPIRPIVAVVAIVVVVDVVVVVVKIVVSTVALNAETVN